MPIDAAPDRTDEATLADLRRRLEATRRTPLPPARGWERGTDPEYLAKLVGYWAREYDWRPHEERIRALPWGLVESEGLAVRFLRQVASGPAAPAVVLLHGWPDSVLRFERLLPLLDDLDVVVPALPGYPFAAPATAEGMSVTAMADLVGTLMEKLGYGRYVVSGGDIGASVAEAMADAFPERVAALHLSEVPYRHLFADLGDPRPQEREFLEGVRRWLREEGAYALEQSTKPRSLAPALADSPAGLAAWIVEKLRSWSDCGGDLEAAFPREELLTWISAYWVSGAIGGSFSAYVEPPRHYGLVKAPAAFTLFPHDLMTAPREFAERFFDLRHWTVAPAGGHFGAWEQPAAYAEGVRAALAVGAGPPP